MKTKSTAAQVAALIRKELKAHNVPARVTSENFAGGNSVNVWLFDPLPKTLERVTMSTTIYEYGYFDGMTDSYNYSNVRDDIPQVKYLFVNAEYSDELRQECWDYLRAHFNYVDAPADWHRSGEHPVYMGMIHSGWELINHELRNGSHGFWFSKKQRLVA